MKKKILAICAILAAAAGCAAITLRRKHVCEIPVATPAAREKESEKVGGTDTSDIDHDKTGDIIPELMYPFNPIHYKISVDGMNKIIQSSMEAAKKGLSLIREGHGNIEIDRYVANILVYNHLIEILLDIYSDDVDDSHLQDIPELYHILVEMKSDSESVSSILDHINNGATISSWSYSPVSSNEIRYTCESLLASTDKYKCSVLSRLRKEYTSFPSAEFYSVNDKPVDVIRDNSGNKLSISGARDNQVIIPASYIGKFNLFLRGINAAIRDSCDNVFICVSSLNIDVDTRSDIHQSSKNPDKTSRVYVFYVFDSTDGSLISCRTTIADPDNKIFRIMYDLKDNNYHFNCLGPILSSFTPSMMIGDFMHTSRVTSDQEIPMIVEDFLLYTISGMLKNEYSIYTEPQDLYRRHNCLGSQLFHDTFESDEPVLPPITMNDGADIDIETQIAFHNFHSIFWDSLMRFYDIEPHMSIASYQMDMYDSDGNTSSIITLHVYGDYHDMFIVGGVIPTPIFRRSYLHRNKLYGDYPKVAIQHYTREILGSMNVDEEDIVIHTKSPNVILREFGPWYKPNEIGPVYNQAVSSFVNNYWVSSQMKNVNFVTPIPCASLLANYSMILLCRAYNKSISKKTSNAYIVGSSYISDYVDKLLGALLLYYPDIEGYHPVEATENAILDVICRFFDTIITLTTDKYISTNTVFYGNEETGVCDIKIFGCNMVHPIPVEYSLFSLLLNAVLGCKPCGFDLDIPNEERLALLDITDLNVACFDIKMEWPLESIRDYVGAVLSSVMDTVFERLVPCLASKAETKVLPISSGEWMKFIEENRKKIWNQIDYRRKKFIKSHSDNEDISSPLEFIENMSEFIDALITEGEKLSMFECYSVRYLTISTKSEFVTLSGSGNITRVVKKGSTIQSSEKLIREIPINSSAEELYGCILECLKSYTG